MISEETINQAGYPYIGQVEHKGQTAAVLFTAPNTGMGSGGIS